MKYALPAFALLLIAACASGTPEPTRVRQIIYITPTPSAAGGTPPTDEPLPFRDLSTATSTPALASTDVATLQMNAPTAVSAATPTRGPDARPQSSVSLQSQPATISPTQRPAPTAAAIQPASDAAGAEQAIIDLTNVYRLQNGLLALARDEAIMNIARSRSADMVARDYFGHTDPVTGAALAKPQVLALGYGRAGENIYWSGAALADFPAQAMKWLMGDAPHRANILNSGYTAIGVGVVWNGLGWVLTQNFGGP